MSAVGALALLGLTATSWVTSQPRAVQAHREALLALGLVATREAMDQAYLLLYLAADASRFVTGQIFRANGGQSITW